MKVFIIGGTGLLGSEGVRELLNRGHQVTTLAPRAAWACRACSAW